MLGKDRAESENAELAARVKDLSEQNRILTRKLKEADEQLASQSEERVVFLLFIFLFTGCHCQCPRAGHY